jgi:hypothetical protein
VERTQFTFYESFFKAISRIKKDADRGKAYDAICAYALYGTEPDLDELPDSAAIAFELSKPNLDASRRKASSGKRGGESKQTESKTEANAKQNGSKTETNAKQTESKKENKKEKEKEKENKCYNPVFPFSEILSSAGFGDTLNDAVADWLSYKQEKRQPYKETGFKSLVSEIRNNASVYGEDAVAALIRKCMASNWQGIIFDRLGKPEENPLNMAVPKKLNTPAGNESMVQYAAAFRKKVANEQ